MNVAQMSFALLLRAHSSPPKVLLFFANLNPLSFILAEIRKQVVDDNVLENTKCLNEYL